MEALFSSATLSDLLEQRGPHVLAEVEAISAEHLLNAVEHDLCAALVERYRVALPTLLTDKVAIHEQVEADIDVRHDRSRDIRDRSRPFHVKGQRIVVAVPFEGDPVMFQFRPSHFSLSPPRADIVGDELRLTFQGVDLSAEEVKRGVQGAIGSIEGYLTTGRGDVKQFNASLPSIVEGAVSRRKQRLLQQRGMVEALGIPVRPRADAPATYSLPVKRRVPVIETVPTTSQPYAPEPALATEEYENILRTAQNMALVMERSPSAFKEMKEEDLRQQFLVQLNGQYEGEAAGEVFNYRGKTDILIRHQGRNVFIAECKFWTGAKKFLETVDQLLSYTSWRDTKTAVFLFNRNRDLSRVLGQVSELLRQHSCHKRDLPQTEPTRFRAVLRRPDDAAREVVLTVCVFDVPAADSGTSQA